MQTRFVEEIKGLGKVHLAKAPFDEQIKYFNSLGIKYPVSVRDASYMRLNGKDNSLRDGTRTCHAPICAKDSPTIITRISPLLSSDLHLCKQIIKAHRNNQYFVAGNDKTIYGLWEKIAKADKNKKPQKQRAIILPTRSDYQINKDSPAAEFFFGDTREDYFNKFVPGGDITAYQISETEIDSKNGTLLNYIWFDGPEDDSDLNFRDRDLNYDYGAFGVLRSRKATEPSQKISVERLHYSQREIEKELIRISKLESELAKTKLFFEKLKR